MSKDHKPLRGGMRLDSSNGGASPAESSLEDVLFDSSEGACSSSSESSPHGSLADALFGGGAACEPQSKPTAKAKRAPKAKAKRDEDPNESLSALMGEGDSGSKPKSRKKSTSKKAASKKATRKKAASKKAKPKASTASKQAASAAEPVVEAVAAESVAEPVVEAAAAESVAEPVVEAAAAESVAEPVVEAVAAESVAEPVPTAVESEVEPDPPQSSAPVVEECLVALFGDEDPLKSNAAPAAPAKRAVMSMSEHMAMLGAEMVTDEPPAPEVLPPEVDATGYGEDDYDDAYGDEDYEDYEDYDDEDDDSPAALRRRAREERDFEPGKAWMLPAGLAVAALGVAGWQLAVGQNAAGAAAGVFGCVAGLGAVFLKLRSL